MNAREQELSGAGLHGGELALLTRTFGDPIPPDKVAGLFQPLRRSATAERDAERSVGLGLYIIDQVVRAHGGRVEVRSTEAEGTLFRVHLPRGAPAAEARLV